MARLDVRALLPFVAIGCAPSCLPAASPPWPGGGGAVVAEHADVRTLNDGYRRTTSHVLVREVDVPTRAALDYAAYHANFMIADPPPESPQASDRAPDTSHPFGGLVDRATLTSDVGGTPLTAEERRHPLAFAPAVTYLESGHVAGAAELAEVAAAIRSEAWGLPATPGVSSQAPSEAFLHVPPAGPAEIWVKVEFSPWFTAFHGLPDQDGDGFPEVYGRVRPDHAPATAVDAWRGAYTKEKLGPKDVKGWANQLSSYWYPSFNTDLLPPPPKWPDEHTEPDITKELGGRVFPEPTFVLRGKPEGKATYEIFLIKGLGDAKTTESTPAAGPLVLPKTRPTPDPSPLADAVTRELSAHGGSWQSWAAEVAPFDGEVKKRLGSAPRNVKAFAGEDGFLFYRSSLDYVVGGDLANQPKDKNPIPVILEFKRALEAHGVDFLFVPVPTKAEVFPDVLAPSQKALVGKVVNPYLRKLAQDLAAQGVEVVDLLTPFLAARAAAKVPGEEPLFQRQDTHWTDRGLTLAADVLSRRLRRFPWYAALAPHAQHFSVKETNFTRFGDLHSRLPEPKKKGYVPETLVAHQVVRADGTLYDDDPDSPIVVLGDSFTGVYELTDAEHAGVSAHLARGVSYPVDLVMSYGGGPNVRQKLMRRGAAALDTKKVVIWLMTARDLYRYWEAWEPLESK